MNRKAGCWSICRRKRYSSSIARRKTGYGRWDRKTVESSGMDTVNRERESSWKNFTKKMLRKQIQKNFK